jgi:hypothetical protein
LKLIQEIFHGLLLVQVRLSGCSTNGDIIGLGSGLFK